jgi:hypothetical protein
MVIISDPAVAQIFLSSRDVDENLEYGMYDYEKENVKFLIIIHFLITIILGCSTVQVS